MAYLLLLSCDIQTFPVTYLYHCQRLSHSLVHPLLVGNQPRYLIDKLCSVSFVAFFDLADFLDHFVSPFTFAFDIYIGGIGETFREKFKLFLIFLKTPTTKITRAWLTTMRASDVTFTGAVIIASYAAGPTHFLPA